MAFDEAQNSTIGVRSHSTTVDVVPPKQGVAQSPGALKTANHKRGNGVTGPAVVTARNAVYSHYSDASSQVVPAATSALAQQPPSSSSDAPNAPPLADTKHITGTYAQWPLENGRVRTLRVSMGQLPKIYSPAMVEAAIEEANMALLLADVPIQLQLTYEQFELGKDKTSDIGLMSWIIPGAGKKVWGQTTASNEWGRGVREGDRIANAVVELQDPENISAEDRNLSPLPVEEQVAQTLVHELLHAVGLEDNVNAPDGSTIMGYREFRPQGLRFGDNDIAGLRKAYAPYHWPRRSIPPEQP